MSRPKKCLLILAGVFAAFILLGIIGIITDSSQAPEPTPTPAPTATPEHQRGPTATPTATPTPMTRDPLETTELAHLWIQIVRDEVIGGSEFWDVLANPVFDVDRFELNVYIDGREYCNPNPLYGDQGFGELGCESYEPRTQEPEVYATVGNSLFGSVERLVCAQNVATRSRYNMIYACYWHEGS